jgi:Mrp family chromosome partitioning ATPase
LRDNLVAKGVPRVLAVSSASPNEGKTTCAINLALALAEHASGRLLLVDTNFFAPTLAGMLSVDEYVPPSPSPDLPWVAPFKLSALTPCLHVATLLRKRDEAVPILDHRKLGRLIESFCRAGYEHVILDTPALDGSPTVSQLLRAAEGTLLTVRAGKTTSRALHAAIDRVGEGRVCGLVLVESR